VIRSGQANQDTEEIGKEVVLTTCAVLHKMAFGGMGKQVRLRATSFGWKAGVVGVAALALLNFFYQQRDDCLS